MRRKILFTQKRFLFILGAGLLVLASLACEFNIGAGGGPAGVTGVTTCKAVDADQKCSDQTAEFESTQTIYVSAQVNNLAKTDRVTARWFQGTSQVQEFTLPMEQAGSGYVAFSLIPEGTFPPGDYSAQVFLNDTLAQTAKFKVKGQPVAAAPTEEPPLPAPTPTSEPTEAVNSIATEEAAVSTSEESLPDSAASVVKNVTTCRVINEDSSCQDQTTTFAPTDTMHASVEVAGASAGTVITARWLQGSDKVDETPLTLDTGGSGYLDFTLTPNEPFPSDTYTVEIYQAETQVAQVELLVEEVGADAPAEQGAAVTGNWQTYQSKKWQVSVDHPSDWQVLEDENAFVLMGAGKTSFYLTSYTAEGAAEEATRSTAQAALDKLAETFGDLQSSELESFNLGGFPGLTSDYTYTDGEGDVLNGSIIVVTPDSGLTYLIYIEALAGDYEAALNQFNPMLQSLTFN